MSHLNDNLLKSLIKRKAIEPNVTEMKVNYITLGIGGLKVRTSDHLIVERITEKHGKLKIHLYRPFDERKVQVASESIELLDYQTAEAIAEAFELDLDGNPIQKTRRGRPKKVRVEG